MFLPSGDVTLVKWLQFLISFFFIFKVVLYWSFSSLGVSPARPGFGTCTHPTVVATRIVFIAAYFAVF